MSRPGTLADRIGQALAAAGSEGLAVADLIAAMGKSHRRIKTAVLTMRQRGELFPGGPQRLRRYFATAELAAAAEPLLRARFAAESAARAEAAAERRRIRMRARYVPSPNGRTAKQQAQIEQIRRAGTAASPWRLEQPTKSNTVPAAVRHAPVEIPADFPVTRLPSHDPDAWRRDFRGAFSRAGIGRYLQEPSA